MRQLLAEAIGTFALVFCGTGAIIIDQLYGGPIGHLGICLVFGLVVMAMIYAVGEISGAHFNPAVSLGFAVAGVFPWRRVPAYVLAQCAAALVASAGLSFIFPAATTLGQTLPANGAVQSFVLEVVLTFFLMFVIINVAKGSKEQGLMAGLAIGATVALAAIFGGPVSGASMNPARSLGPAVVSGTWQYHWLYWFAPALGAGLAILAWRGVKGTHNPA